MPGWLNLTNTLIVIDVLSMLLIILLVLLHSGRGGGVSDMFGGGASAAASGSTVAERNLDRYTIALVVIFVFSTMALAIRMQ